MGLPINHTASSEWEMMCSSNRQLLSMLIKTWTKLPEDISKVHSTNSTSDIARVHSELTSFSSAEFDFCWMWVSELLGLMAVTLDRRNLPVSPKLFHSLHQGGAHSSHWDQVLYVGLCFFGSCLTHLHHLCYLTCRPGRWVTLACSNQRAVWFICFQSQCLVWDDGTSWAEMTLSWDGIISGTPCCYNYIPDTHRPCQFCCHEEPIRNLFSSSIHAAGIDFFCALISHCGLSSLPQPPYSLPHCQTAVLHGDIFPCLVIQWLFSHFTFKLLSCSSSSSHSLSLCHPVPSAVFLPSSLGPAFLPFSSSVVLLCSHLLPNAAMLYAHRIILSQYLCGVYRIAWW